MFSTLAQSFQWEDVILFVWVGFVEPLLARLFTRLLGNTEPWNIGAQQNPFLGIIFLGAGLGGIIVLATRSPGQKDPEKSSSSVAFLARLPMLVTLGYMFIYATSAFNATSDNVILLVVCAPLAVLFVSGMMFERLPQVDIAVRRILVGPLILLSTWNFSAIVHLILGNTDLRQAIPPAIPQIVQNPNSLFAFTIGILVAAVVFFYAVFVFAPRQIAFPNGSGRDWLVRFGLFVVGVVFNIGFLQP